MDIHSLLDSLTCLNTALLVPLGLLCLRAIVKQRRDLECAVRVLEAFAAGGALDALEEGLGLVPWDLKRWITLWDMSPPALVAVARLRPECITTALPVVLGLQYECRVTHGDCWSKWEYIRAGSVAMALRLVPYLDLANNPDVVAMYRRQQFVVNFLEEEEDGLRAQEPFVTATASCYDLLRHDGRLYIAW